MTSDDGMTITETLSQAVARQAAEIERLLDRLADCNGARVANANALRLAKDKNERLRGLLGEVFDYHKVAVPMPRKWMIRVWEALGDE